MKLVLKIAGGILLAAALTVGATSAYIAYETRQEARQQAAASMALAAAKVKQDEQAVRQRQSEERRAQEIRKRANAAAAAKAKEAAWKDHYRAPQHCDNPPGWAALVECINHRLKAKENFDRDYKPDAPRS